MEASSQDNNFELKNSELCILKNYKHSLLIEAPREVGERVREFLLKLS